MPFDIIAALVGAGLGLGLMEIRLWLRARSLYRPPRTTGSLPAPALVVPKGINKNSGSLGLCQDCPTRTRDYVEYSDGSVRCYACAKTFDQYGPPVKVGGAVISGRGSSGCW